MAETTPLDVEQLYQHLRASLRYGARASRLWLHVPAIVELLYPAAEYPELADYDRALRVEADIRTAIDHDIAGEAGEAIAIVLGLRPGTLGRPLGARRRIAAHHLNIEAETFRRDWYEKALLLDVTIEMYRHHLTRQPHHGRPPTTSRT